MKKKLFKVFVITSLLLITFFSFQNPIIAANFKYSEFDWDEFAEENKSYWVSACDSSLDEDCVDKVLATKERFYTRLYEMLDKVDKQYGFIDDNIIIATVFYGLDSDAFADPSINDYDPYNLDDSDDSPTKDLYIGKIDSLLQEVIEYFTKEKDSLKKLINSFIGYRSICYGESDEVPNSEGVCSTSTMVVIKDKCYDKVNTYAGTFMDSIGLSFLGTKNKKKCVEEALEKGYTKSKLYTSDEKEVSEEFYWDALENGNYLDNKDHLQDYFISVLGKVKKDHMNELTEEEMLENEEDIKKVRKRIIEGIKEVLKYFEGISDEYNKKKKEDAYWWPIGSIETTETDGVLFASGDPESVEISSNYGLRTHPVTGESNSMHKGIDITGSVGSTNVIASKDGTVVYVTEENGNCSEGDSECGGGYGNYIIIQHIDGNFTLYAHLHTNSLVVSNGDSVKKGQVIGKVGSTGSSTGGHLHFEVRVGNNSGDSTQDPLNFVDPDEPRKTGSVGEFEEWLKLLESGGLEERYIKDGKYLVFDAEKKGNYYRSVINGVVVDFNKERVRKYGLNPDTIRLGDYVDMETMDKVMVDIVEEKRQQIESVMSKNQITLTEEQIQALIALSYNCGNIEGFVKAYNTYGETESLCTNWWINKASSGYPGLPKRRRAECKLFVEGDYSNPYVE